MRKPLRPQKKVRKKKGKTDSDEDDAQVGDELVQDPHGRTRSWRKDDYYGGEDAGDDADDDDEDEEAVFEEARKLEVLRAQRLQSGGADDFLSKLLSSHIDAAKHQEEVEKLGFASFESALQGEEEHSTVERDLSKLSEADLRGVMRKEAPELVPLLEQFRDRLTSLRQIVPLLTAGTPASGASYLEARALLEMNTLSNLSFYLLLRAEGRCVRAHPIMSQLAWLQQLQNDIKPVNERVSSKVQKVLKSFRRCTKKKTNTAVEVSAVPSDVAQARPRQKVSLREKIEILRSAAPVAVEPLRVDQGMSTDDLLKLPASRKKRKTVPDELQDVDPVLGAWRPGSLREEMAGVQQALARQAAQLSVGGVEDNVAPRQRQAKQRRSEPQLDIADEGAPEREEQPDVEDENEMVRSARQAARSKKEQKEAVKKAREAALLKKQNKPEELVDGRRVTSKIILKNRGLVRQRKKYSGNARVAGRKKYEKSLKRWKGAVQEVREGAADGATYHGEDTGLKKNVKKSTKLT